jgi:hypothetical protein
MQNIDPVYFLLPIVVAAFSFGLVIYWHYKRSFTRAVLLYSLVAYAGAILLKVILQQFTATGVINMFGFASVVDGLYFGLQTAFFEIGGAFLVALLGVRRGAFAAQDVEGYGLGLAFWENGILLGSFAVVNLLAVYITIASNSSAAPSYYSALLKTQPQLFYPPLEALPLVGFGILERVSSLLLHFSWGYLCFVAALTGRRSYFLAALPMGLIDFLVVFQGLLTVAYFEAIVFALSIGCLALSLDLTRNWRKKT